MRIFGYGYYSAHHYPMYCHYGMYHRVSMHDHIINTSLCIGESVHQDYHISSLFSVDIISIKCTSSSVHVIACMHQHIIRVLVTPLCIHFTVHMLVLTFTVVLHFTLHLHLLYIHTYTIACIIISLLVE